MVLGILGTAGVVALGCVGYKFSKPYLQRQLGDLVELIAPRFLGGAKVTIKQILMNLGCNLTLGVDDLRIDNLPGWNTEYLLDLDETTITVNLCTISKSACANVGKPTDIEIPALIVKGCTLNYEKSMMSSNVHDLTEAMNKQEQKEQAEKKSLFDADAVMKQAQDAAKQAQDKANAAAADLQSKASGNGTKPAEPPKPTNLILHKVVIEDVRMIITSSFGTQKASAPTINIADFYAEYGAATPRSLLHFLISHTFSNAAGALGDSVSGLSSSALSFSSGMANKGQAAVKDATK